VKELTGQTNQATGLHQDRIHLAVDADASVTRSLARLLREPVLLIAYPQRLDEGSPEHLQLLIGHDGRFFVQAQEADEKVGC